MPILSKITQLKHSIRWNLFITLGFIMLICQLITIFWLWHESKEQIEVIVDLTLSEEATRAVVKHEELEAIFALLLPSCIIMLVTLLLAYQAIKRITKPLERLQRDLAMRAAENLSPINSVSDMQEIKAISVTLNSLFYRLNETLQQERLFTADVAHELRTPLAGIRLHLELLERNQHIPCQELIERIDRLVNTVEQLLTLARASQKFITGNEQLINFEKNIVNLMANELAEMVEPKKQTLIWHIPDQPLLFLGDMTLLCLLLRNLVENASRYSPEQSEIVISGYQYNEQQIVLEVKDTGPGIDEDKIAQLTQAFFRMDRRHKGIGLGLSIVQRIIKLHQGQLILRNRDDGHGGTLVQCIFHC